MKKFIAVLLCFAAIFAFAACNKKVAENATTAATTLPFNVITDANGNPQTELAFEFVTDKNGTVVGTTYRPEYETYKVGEAITNANGDYVTETKYFLDLDENGNPILGEDGKVLTTVGFSNVTYAPAPGETVPPKSTNPVGYTNPSENAKWPSDKFMAKLPKLRDKVDKVNSVSNEKGNFVNIHINELSYADFLKYIETCKKAGFTQSNTGTKIPESPESGKSYYYYSASNGLYLTIVYYTDEYPQRTCDLFITVSDYDMLEDLG